MDPAFSDLNTRIGGDAESDARDAAAAAAAADSSSFSVTAPNMRMLGGVFGLVAALALVAFILVLILWFQVQTLRKQMRELVCTKLKDLLTRDEWKVWAGSAGLDTIGSWSTVLTATALLTGASNAPMLFSVATPSPPTTVTQDAQTGASSIIQAPFAGTIKALQVQLNALPSTGTITIGVSINGQLSTCVGQITATLTGPVLTFKPVVPVKFKVADTIGLFLTYPAATVVPGGVLLASAQIVVQYAAPRCSM